MQEFTDQMCLKIIEVPSFLKSLQIIIIKWKISTYLKWLWINPGWKGCHDNCAHCYQEALDGQGIHAKKEIFFSIQFKFQVQWLLKEKLSTLMTILIQLLTRMVIQSPFPFTGFCLLHFAEAGSLKNHVWESEVISFMILQIAGIMTRRGLESMKDSKFCSWRLS